MVAVSLKKKFFKAEDGIRDGIASRGLGDVYKRQEHLPSSLGAPLGFPKVPQEAQMSPQVTQNQAQNEVRKVSKMENANCEQNTLFTMF